VDAHQRSRASGTGIGRSSRATLGNLRSGRGPDRLLIGTSVRQFPKLFQQVVRVPGRIPLRRRSAGWRYAGRMLHFLTSWS